MLSNLRYSVVESVESVESNPRKSEVGGCATTGCGCGCRCRCRCERTNECTCRRRRKKCNCNPRRYLLPHVSKSASRITRFDGEGVLNVLGEGEGVLFPQTYEYIIDCCLRLVGPCTLYAGTEWASGGIAARESSNRDLVCECIEQDIGRKVGRRCGGARRAAYG